jgi:hypothetical protein
MSKNDYINNIREAMAKIEASRNAIAAQLNNEEAQENLKNALEEEFLNSTLTDETYVNKGDAKDYYSSKYRLEKYKSLINDDNEYNLYLRNLYGNANTFLETKTNLIENRNYDPLTDFVVEVGIITEDSYYKGSFISYDEVILELLNGTCTIDFIRVNGLAGMIVGTLSKDKIPSSQGDVRLASFAGLGGGRILVWNLLKGKWSSFYMSNLRRFMSDETSDIQ